MATKTDPITIGADFPSKMRRQLWPLCCGASILSGFKHAQVVSEEALLKEINEVITNTVPDFQVFAHESMMPKLTFLTLNSEQMSSKKVMAAIKEAGFVKFAEGKPRGAPQGFFVQDKSNSFKVIAA